MNPSLIANLNLSSESSAKGSFESKKININTFGKKYRRGKRYNREQEEKRLEKLRKSQRKREKVAHETWRRADMPEKKDIIL